MSMRYSPKRRFLRWTEWLFLLAGCLTLGFSAFVYIQASLYQVSEARQFENTLSSASPALEMAPQRELQTTLRTPTQDGSPIGRIEIPRIGVSAVVVEGVTPRSLRLAVGHIPGTALPGESGNIGIAGHRDTFFRGLRHIRGGDTVTVATLHGSYEYSVESTEIADPGSVRALQPSSEPMLTLITCYPFYFVGPAPQRFIVRAHPVDTKVPIPH